MAQGGSPSGSPRSPSGPRLVFWWKKHCHYLIFWSFCMKFETLKAGTCRFPRIPPPWLYFVMRGQNPHRKSVVFLGGDFLQIFPVFELLPHSPRYSYQCTFNFWNKFRMLPFIIIQAGACPVNRLAVTKPCFWACVFKLFQKIQVTTKGLKCIS